MEMIAEPCEGDGSDDDGATQLAEAEHLLDVESTLREEIAAGRRHIEDSTERLQHTKQTMEEATKFWREKVSVLEVETRHRQFELDARIESLRLMSIQEGDLPPPGPASLLFLDSNAFSLVSIFVVLVNIATMLFEMLHPQYEVDFYWLDQFFMQFYVIELALKAILWRRRLLIGPIRVVWWNWLDLFVVSIGVLDQWLKPCLMTLASLHTAGASKGGASESSSMLRFVRMLRLARLARILKLARIFFQSDLSWAEGNRFQLFIMSVIGSNCLIMSLETDFPDFFLWVYVEQVLLAIFSFELAVRLKLYGCKFFAPGEDVLWNYFDFTIVVGGIIDQWLMPSAGLAQGLMGLKPTDSGQMGQFMVLLRMARLLRILRLVRLVRSIPPLFMLIVGIVQAMQGMFWVLVLTAVLLYVFAILAVKLIGHGLLFGGEENVPSNVKDVFPDVVESMFVLFMAMNGQTDHLDPLFDRFPLFRLAFVAYMVLSSWAILSILTAVMSENMINVFDSTKEEHAKDQREQRWEKLRRQLNQMLSAADADGSGTIDRAEFGRLCQGHCIDELCEAGGGLSKDQLFEMFDSLSSIRNETSIPLDDLVQLVQEGDRPVRRRECVHLEMRMANMERALHRVEAALKTKD